MEKINQLIKESQKSNTKINFCQIEELCLNNAELDYLLKQLDKNKIKINDDSIYMLINSKVKKINQYSDTEIDSIEQYFKEINQIDILDVCEEKILFYFYKENKNYAVRNSLALFYLRLVVSIAKEYAQRTKNTSYQLLDVIQDGNSGLLRAIEKYDVMIGVRFSIYATWWIRRYIESGMIENSKSIRIPMRIIEDYNKIMKFITVCKSEGRQNITNLAIAKATGLAESRVSYVLNIASRTVISLDEYIGDSHKNTKFGMIPSGEPMLEDLTIEKIEYELVNRIMRSVLTEKELFIVSCKNGFINEFNKLPGEKTLDEVGKILGLTRERIRQILKPAYEKIKNAYENELNSKKITKTNKK